MKIAIDRAREATSATSARAGERTESRNRPGPALPRLVPPPALLAIQRRMQPPASLLAIQQLMKEGAQQRAATVSVTADAPAQRQEARQAHNSGLPDGLKSGIEQISGVAMDDVTVHYNSDKPAQLQALAYAQGSEIYVAPGQDSSVPNEAWHVVQQKQRRLNATSQVRGASVNDDPGLEQEADVMGAKALRRGGQAAGGCVQALATVGASPYPGRRAAEVVVRGSRGGTIQRRSFGEAWRSSGLGAMTLSTFHAYVTDRNNIDKENNIIGVAQSDQKSFSVLRAWLVGDGDNLTLADRLFACGAMKVSALRDEFPDDRLNWYTRAVQGRIPSIVSLRPANDPRVAAGYGAALKALNSINLDKKMIRQRDLDEMIWAQAIDPFVDYVMKCQPVLEAPNGVEIQSYLALLLDEGQDPVQYKDKLKHVRNFHRFERAALDQLVVNEQIKDNKKPVTLVLHSARDYNGAFHRDPGMTKVITHPKNLTLMNEGSDKLRDIDGWVSSVGKSHGKVAQVMFAGHGNSRSIELAYNAQVDLDAKTDVMENLLFSVIESLDPKSDPRVVFKGCLTDSNDIAIRLDKDPEKARRQIRDYIEENGSLTAEFRKLAEDKNIVSLGTNGSTSRRQRELIDAKTGKLKITSKYDRTLMGEKLDYVEYGKDPAGAMRALVETLAYEDNVDTRAAMRRRVRDCGSLEWKLVLIRSLFELILEHDNDLKNLSLINEITRFAAHLDCGERSREVKHVERLVAPLKPLDGGVDFLFSALSRTLQWYVSAELRLVYRQVWMGCDKRREGAFVAELSRGDRWDCARARNFVDLDTVAQHPGLLPEKPGASRGELILALMLVFESNNNLQLSAAKYLRKLKRDDQPFSTKLGVPSLLAGTKTMRELLVVIDKDYKDTQTTQPSEIPDEFELIEIE